MIIQRKGRQSISNRKTQQVFTSRFGYQGDTLKIFLKHIVRNRLVTVMEPGKQFLSELVGKTNLNRFPPTRMWLECFLSQSILPIGKRGMGVQIIVIIQYHFFI